MPISPGFGVLSKMLTQKMQNDYLKWMGIEQWRERVAQKNVPEILPSEENNEDAWLTLEKAVANCTACPLHKTRKNTVFGTGNRNAQVMFIGEAPGAEEDRQGKPFVGRAGQLLTEMLYAIGLSREEVFIANILKSRPPGNRDPHQDEVNACTPFLRKQIELINPKLLVSLGRISAHFLLDTKTPMARLHGQVFQYNQTPLLVTYHPAYLLRNPVDKAKAYDDLRKIRPLLIDRR